VGKLKEEEITARIGECRENMYSAVLAAHAWSSLFLFSL
jgi:hypothetical protein